MWLFKATSLIMSNSHYKYEVAFFVSVHVFLSAKDGIQSSALLSLPVNNIVDEIEGLNA